MAGGLRQWRLLLGVMLALTVPVVAAEGGGARAPALFVFGDSLIDSGNNNNLASLAKANYFPYGIDFADGPTGRFCNGYTIVDELAAGAAPGAALLPGIIRPADPAGRQLRFRRRRDPRRQRPKLRGADPVQPADRQLRVDGGPDRRRGRRGGGGRQAGAVHPVRRDGEQRLPEQLPHAQLRHQAPVQPAAVRRPPRPPVRLPAHQAVQCRGEEVCGGRRGVDGVHPERAGAEPHGPVLAGGGRPRAAVQRQREGDARRPERRPRRSPVHVPRQLPGVPSHPRRPGLLRVQRGGPGVLRDREERRAGDVPAVHAAVRGPGALRVLGRVPPDGGGERDHRQAGVPWRRRRRRPHQRSPACQPLKMIRT